MELKDLVTERDQFVQLRGRAEAEEDLAQLESLDEQIDTIDEQIRDFVLEHVDAIEGSLRTVVVLSEVIEATWGHDDDGNRDEDLAGESGADIVDRLSQLAAHVNFDQLLESVRPLVDAIEDEGDDEDFEDADGEEDDDEDSGET